MVDKRWIQRFFMLCLVYSESLILKGSSVLFQTHNRNLPQGFVTVLINTSEVIDASDKQICTAGAVVFVNQGCGIAEPQRLLVNPVHFTSSHTVGSNHHPSGVVCERTVVSVAFCGAYLIERQVNVASGRIYHTIVVD